MRTSTRLGLTSMAILALFAIALLVVLRAMDRVARADAAVVTSEQSKDSGHRVAALVREQYIHQAHTIIEGNRSHIDHYKDIAARTRAASDKLVDQARTAEQRAMAQDVASLVRKNDDDFMSVTLRAIDRGDHAEVLRLHMDTELVVGTAIKRIGELNTRFEGDSEAARTEAENVRSSARTTTIACFAGATLLATLLGLLMTRSVARRVATLHEGAQRLGEGNLSRRIALGGTDEFAELSRSFDEMAEKLADHQRELVRTQKLASIGRLSAGIAHEINGPLGIILGYVKVIRTQGLDDEALRAIEDEAGHCQKIVKGLLELARNEPLELTIVDLGELAREAVDRLRAAGTLGERTIVLPNGAGAQTTADATKMRQVVLAILTNAAEATADAGTITITAKCAGDHVVLSIADDGPGLSTEARSRLFEPFFTTKSSGTGLGLALAHAHMEAHRGDLRVTDNIGNTGTRVDVQLPRLEA